MLTAQIQIGTWPQSVAEFERLIEATQDELVQHAFCRLGNRQDAEDTVQDVYVEAFRDRQKRAHITEVRAYLFRMVGNRCTDVRRRWRFTTGPLDDHHATSDTTFSQVAGREQAERFARLLAELPPAEAEVIRLRAWSDLSFAEVAAAVGSSVPTVKSRFRYGLDKLRRLLMPEGGPNL
jgi:RNA polymerase sigma-70 factor (ECF subfamily)